MTERSDGINPLESQKDSPATTLFKLAVTALSTKNDSGFSANKIYSGPGRENVRFVNINNELPGFEVGTMLEGAKVFAACFQQRGTAQEGKYPTTSFVLMEDDNDPSTFMVKKIIQRNSQFPLSIYINMIPIIVAESRNTEEVISTGSRWKFLDKDTTQPIEDDENDRDKAIEIIIEDVDDSEILKVIGAVCMLASVRHDREPLNAEDLIKEFATMV